MTDTNMDSEIDRDKLKDDEQKEKYGQRNTGKQKDRWIDIQKDKHTQKKKKTG